LTHKICRERGKARLEQIPLKSDMVVARRKGNEGPHRKGMVKRLLSNKQLTQSLILFENNT